jgi:polyisoprenoid-binding protein YceI
MKYLLSSLLLLTLLACGQAPEGEKVTAGEAVATPTSNQAEAITLAIDTETSVINWTGAKLVGKQHNGTIQLASGELKIANDQIVGGNFVIDMNSISNSDMEGGGKERLEGHLMSDDFFSVATYPTATFEIAEVKAIGDKPDATHEITGNLTMRGITKSIVIPANVSMSEAGVKAMTPAFTIDRTQWEVMYDAGVLGTAKDDIINDEIGLTINLATR